jgi:MFS transporter, DHA2 family, multidrug resistance protein
MNGDGAKSGPQVEKIRPKWLKWAIALTVSFGAVLQIIDVSIVNVSLPQMQGNLGATISEIGWVVTGYAIASAIVIPLTAWLGKFIGQKAYFIFSLVAFVMASVMCGMSTTLPMLIVARVLQGLFGGGLVPRAQAIMFETFGPSEIGMAQAVFGAGMIAGPTFGPTLGGYITDTLGWRWIFFINVPVGIIAVLLATAFLPSSKSDRSLGRQVDWIGISLLAIWLGSFQTFLEEGQADGWFQSGFITRLAVAAVVGFGLFVWWELRNKLPAVDLRVLRHRSLAAGSLYSIVLGISLFGTIFVIPIFTQRVLGFTAVQSGELMIPGAVATAALMPVVGFFVSKFDARLSILMSNIVVGYSMFLLADVNINTSVHTLYLPLILRGAGMGFMFIPLSIATLGAIPKKDIPAASGFFNLTRQIGGSIGIAMLTTILDKRQVFHYDRLIENISTYNPAAVQYLAQVQAGIEAKGFDPITAQKMALGIADGTTHLHAMILSFEDIYLFVGSLFVIALPLIFFLGKGSKERVPVSAG